MTNLLVLVLIAVQIYAVVAFAKLAKTVGQPKEKKAETIDPMVTRSDPGFVKEITIGQADDSAIVMPKTPQRIEFEESEELRKMNLGPR